MSDTERAREALEALIAAGGGMLRIVDSGVEAAELRAAIKLGRAALGATAPQPEDWSAWIAEEFCIQVDARDAKGAVRELCAEVERLSAFARSLAAEAAMEMPPRESIAEWSRSVWSVIKDREDGAERLESWLQNAPPMKASSPTVPVAPSEEQRIEGRESNNGAER